MMKRNIAALLLVVSGLNCGAEPLKLSDAYQLALKNEPKLRASAFRSEATEEGITQSKARLYPQVQGSLSYGGYKYDAQYLRQPVDENYKSYSISASQGLFHPEIWRGIDQAKAKNKGAGYEYQANAQQLGLDLAKAYFNFLRTKRNVDLYASQKEYYEGKYRQLEKMLSMGLTNRIDLLESKVHRDKAIAEWLGEQKRFQVARVKLENMVGASVEELPDYDFGMITPEDISMDRNEWESKLANNPSLKSSLASQEVAQHELAIREYLHLPTVDLSLSRKKTYTQDTVAHTYDTQAIVQMNIPIFQGGYTQSKVREGVLLLNAANQEFDYAQKMTRSKFEELWAERQYSVESLRTLKESEKSAELYVQFVEKGYNAGLKSLVDLLEAKAKYYEVERDLIDAGYQLVNNELGLLDVVGELTFENIVSYEKILSPSVQ